MKNYYLAGPLAKDPETGEWRDEEEEADVVKAKGIARAARKRMAPADFVHSAEAVKHPRYLQTSRLAPTMGGEMTLRLSRRRMTVGYNFKRRVDEVSRRRRRRRRRRAWAENESSILQRTRCHTSPLD